MIVLRRSVAVLLGVVVLVTLAVTLYLWHLNSTILSSGYVVTQLRDQKVYDFVYQDVIPTEVRKGIENPPDVLGQALQRIQLDPNQDTRAVVGLITDLVPEGLVRQHAETTIKQILPVRGR